MTAYAKTLPIYARELSRIREGEDCPASVHIHEVESGNTVTRYAKTTAASPATGTLVAVEVTRKEYVYLRESDAREIQAALHNTAAPACAREALADAVAEALRMNSAGCTRPSIDLKIEEGDGEYGIIKGRARYYEAAATTTRPARAMQALASVYHAAYREAEEREAERRAERDAKRREREAVKVARAIDALRNSGLSKEELQALFA